jgi:hypothetical protein
VKRWKRILNDWDSVESAREKNARKWRKVRRFAAKGVPNAIRGPVWMKFVGSDDWPPQTDVLYNPVRKYVDIILLCYLGLLFIVFN